MQRFCMYFLTIAMLVLGCSGNYTRCMDVRSMEIDAAPGDRPASELPEVWCSIFSKLPMKTYLGVSKVMKLRQVCTQWSALLSDNFIIRTMNDTLLSGRDHYRAIRGKGLAARVCEFCHITLFDEDQNKPIAQKCLAETFDKVCCNNVDHKMLFDRIHRIIRQYGIKPDDMLIMHDFNGSIDLPENGPRHMSLLEVCLRHEFLTAPPEYRCDIFKLLLPDLNLSDHKILDAIAMVPDAAILLTILSPQYNDKVDVGYLFCSLVKQSSWFLVRDYKDFKLGIGLERTCLEQLMWLWVERGMNVERLLAIVKNQQNENIKQRRLESPCFNDLFEVLEKGAPIQEMFQRYPDLESYVEEVGESVLLDMVKDEYVLEDFIMKYSMSNASLGE